VIIGAFAVEIYDAAVNDGLICCHRWLWPEFYCYDEFWLLL